MMGPGVVNYIKNQKNLLLTFRLPCLNRPNNNGKKVYWHQANEGKENPYKLHAELSETMMSNVLIVRDNARLAATVEKIDEYDERWKDVECVDTSDWTNPVPSFVNQLYNMIQLSKVIAKGALLRDEFRGAHYKPEFEINQPSDLSQKVLSTPS